MEKYIRGFSRRVRRHMSAARGNVDEGGGREEGRREGCAAIWLGVPPARPSDGGKSALPGFVLCRRVIMFFEIVVR